MKHAKHEAKCIIVKQNTTLRRQVHNIQNREVYSVFPGSMVGSLVSGNSNVSDVSAVSVDESDRELTALIWECKNCHWSFSTATTFLPMLSEASKQDPVKGYTGAF